MDSAIGVALKDLVYALKDQTAQIECLGALVLALHVPLGIALEALEEDSTEDRIAGLGAGTAVYRVADTLESSIERVSRDNKSLTATVEELLKTQAAKE